MAIPRRSLQGQWSGPWVFMLAIAGASVGLGNIWRFPVLLAEHGGGAFLLAYVAALLLLAVPLMTAEMVIGRSAHRTLPEALRLLARELGRTGGWQVLGWLAVVTAAVLVAAYGVVGGWGFAYGYRAAVGQLAGVGPVEATGVFTALTNDPERLLGWHTLFVVLAALVVGQGLRRGVEPAMRLLVPALIALPLVLLFAASGQMAPEQAWRVVFAPRFEELGVNGVMAAVTHASYGLAVGTGIVVAFSAGMEERWPPVSLATGAVLLDTCVALIAALVVLTVAPALGSAPLVAGPVVAFHAIPGAVDGALGGEAMLLGFYALLVVAALTTAIALLEVVVGAVIEQGSMRRVRATGLVGCVTWLLGVVFLASFHLWPPVIGIDDGLQRLGLPFVAVNKLAGLVLIPTVTLGLVLFIGWVMPREWLRAAIGLRDGWLFWGWYPLVRYLVPLLLVAVFLHVAGVWSGPR